MKRTLTALAGVTTALLAGLAFTVSPAANATVAHHAHRGARPTLTVTFYPRNVVYGAETHVLLEVSGTHGSVHGKVSLSGLGGNCDDTQWLRRHKNKHRLPSDYCTTRHYFSLGTRTATASYYGSRRYRARTVTATFHVVKDHNKVAMSATPASPSTHGTPVRFRAHLIFDGYSTVGSPSTGTFAFRTEDGPIAGCQKVKLDVDTQSANCHATLARGTHTVTSRFSGTKFFTPSSGSMPYTVTR